MKAIHTAKQADVAVIERLIEAPGERSLEWKAGLLAGVFDAEGSWSRGIARFTNTSLPLLAEIREALAEIDVSSVLEGPRPNGVASVRITGGLAACRRFFRVVQPAITRKLNMDGKPVKTSSDLTVVSIVDLGADLDLIDIATGTGDFIANGVISHNCFARNTHTYLDLDAGRDFDTQIIVKVNLVEVLERELARPSWERPNVALGTNTDPYQRAEGRYRLMPGIIAALAASETPFSILTKGTLLRRDIPLLQAAAERVPVETAMSIAVFDDELQRSIEPGAPSTAARLATVRAVREAGLPCSVFLMPVLPFLTDSREHLERALASIADAGATGVAYSALHLRPGAKEWFAAWLAREHPELVPRYRALYGAGAYAPKEYRRQLAARIRPLLRRYGLERPNVDPATGSMGARPRPSARGSGALAAELSPAAAAALQPTLF
jgi:DNA repair photolyase